MIEAAPIPKKNMGQPVVRIDARLKVTGKARYPADIPVSNLAHGVLVTSTIARGTLKSLDIEAARNVPGVIAVITQEDMKGKVEKPQFGSGGTATSIAPLQTTRIEHDGEVIAVVVAETFEAAREGAMLVKAEYTRETPSTTFDDRGIETVAAKDVSKQFKEDPKVGDFAKNFAIAE